MTNVISNLIGKNEKDKRKWDERESAYKIIITDLLINVGS